MNVTNEIIAILDNGLCDGNNFVLQGTLDRKTYVAVNKVLLAAGGKWNRSAKAHVFDCDAQDAVSDIVLTGKVIDAKREFDFFETPIELANKAADMLNIFEGMTVLEPNAGGGSLAREALARGGKVDCIELQQDLASKLAENDNFNKVVQGDFLSLDEISNDKYDRVLMNPPFGKQADIKHVKHAMKQLKSNGRLVSIMSAGVKFRENKLTIEFRDNVEQMGGTFIDLPDNSFKSSGTAVKTVMLILDAA